MKKFNVISNFIESNHLDPLEFKEGSLAMALYLEQQEVATYVKLLDTEDKFSIYLNDIAQVIWETSHLGKTFDYLYIGIISDGSLLITTFFDESFLRKTTLSPNQSYLKNDGLTIEEKKTILRNDLNNCLYNQDFVTINMLTKYFVFNRSNLHRFMKEDVSSLSIEKVDFILNFLHRPVIDLTYGEIKTLISLNCSGDPVRLSEIVKEFGLTLPKFFKIISELEDDTLSVYELKLILYRFHGATMINESKGTEKTSKRMLELKNPLPLSNQYSFKVKREQEAKSRKGRTKNEKNN